MTEYDMCCFRTGKSHEPRPSNEILISFRVLLENFDGHPRHFYMEVPPGGNRA